MSKPEWSDAPEWAQWIAQDVTGHWRWYQEKPRMGNFAWLPGSMKSQAAGRSGDVEFGWRKALERRP